MSELMLRTILLTGSFPLLLSRIERAWGSLWGQSALGPGVSPSLFCSTPLHVRWLICPGGGEGLGGGGVSKDAAPTLWGCSCTRNEQTLATGTWLPGSVDSKMDGHGLQG